MNDVEPGAGVEHLLTACKTIEENCLYTAQTHFVLASRTTTARTAFLVFPAVVSALAGALVAIGFTPYLGVVGALGGMISAVASVLGVDKPPLNHRHAANLFTALRHQARSLHETFWREMPKDTLVAEVKRLEERYSTLLQTLEPTDDEAFQIARARIKEKLFEMDFRQQPPPAAPPGSPAGLITQQGKGNP